MSAQRNERTAAKLATGARPVFVKILAAIGLLFLVAPILGILSRVHWLSLWSQLADPAVRDALILSAWTSAATTIIAVVVGVPLALLLARGHGWTAGFARAFVVLPLVLPPVVSGVALLALLGRTGLIGSRIDTWFGFTIPFTQVAVVVAQLFVALPFLVITVEGALRTKGRHLEQAARTLGASESRIMWSVTIPAVRTAIIAGAALCWARALGEFGATVTFAGSFPGVTQTLPIEVYYSLVTQPDRAIAISVLMIAICVVVLVSLRRSWSGRFLRDT
ncbi:MAG: molybdate ABC transporter permease subunit [Candidatus Nanopelagicales bacterium]